MVEQIHRQYRCRWIVPPDTTACNQVMYQPIPPAQLTSSIKVPEVIANVVAISLPVDIAKQSSSIFQMIAT